MKSATSSDRTRAVIARDPSRSQPALSKAEGRLGMTLSRDPSPCTRLGMTLARDPSPCVRLGMTLARDPSPSARLGMTRLSMRLGMTGLSTRAGMTRLTRSIGLLPQHVLQCPLFLGVDGQELPAQMGVVAVALDVGLALGDGVVEQHELFLVA